MLENVKGDTRLSQMETEINGLFSIFSHELCGTVLSTINALNLLNIILIVALANQINQRRRANRQLQKSIKKKAGELEKLFENLRKGKAHCEMLEQKHKSLQAEKANVEEKVKKCLEVLNSVD